MFKPHKHRERLLSFGFAFLLRSPCPGVFSSLGDSGVSSPKKREPASQWFAVSVPGLSDHAVLSGGSGPRRSPHASRFPSLTGERAG